MIRMSTTQMYNTGMSNMLQSYNRVSTVNNQMGTGKRVLSPADDPVAAAQTLNTKTRMAVVQQYNRNVDFADKNLSLTESVMDQTESSLIRLKEQAIQLGSDQWSDEQVRASGIEAREMLSHLQGLLNTQNESGEYIFAGSQADQKAYNGNTFQGDRIEREAQVADDTFIKMLTSGARAFEDLDGLKTPVIKIKEDPAAPGTLTGFAASYAGDDNLLAFKKQFDAINGAGDKNQWLVDNVFSFPEGTTNADKLAWLTANAADIEARFPAGSLSIAGNTFDMTALSEPEHYYSDNMLGAIQYMVDSLGNGNPASVNKEGIRASINNIDVAFEQVAQTRSQIGARQNTLEAVKSSNMDFEAFATQSISELEDLDYADAYMRLETSMLSYQAGMQVMSKVSGLSLFNYI